MSFLQRAGRSLSRATLAALQPPRGNGSQQFSRSMGGSAHGHGHDNPADYVTYAGVTLKKASSGEEFVAHGLGALMWFWVFYRAYNDFDHKFVGLAQVFDAEGDHDEHDEHHH